MVVRSGDVRKAIAIAALLIAPVCIHVAMATQRGMRLAGWLVLAEAVLIAWVALSFTRVRNLAWLGCVLVFIVTSLVWRVSPDGIVASAAIPHAIAYISLLAVFGSSLMPGRKPIITIFAERSRGELPSPVARYTRRVTWAWCAFCAAQLLGSLLLRLFAPAWMWFPLLVAMFCGEFAWRKWRHGHWPDERLTDGFRMAREVGAITTHDAA
jgi:uncharacterized membrane protein